MAGCIALARNGHISTFSHKSDVTIVFLDPNFLYGAEISVIKLQCKKYIAYFYCASAKRPYFHFGSKIGCYHHVPRP